VRFVAQIVDARGLACPQPVILTRNALAETLEVTTIVDNETAQANVTRLAEKAGATVMVERKGDGIYVYITKKAMAQAEPVPQLACAPAGGPLVLVIPSEIMGRGDEKLGDILIRGFFHTLGEVEPLPDTIIFFNSGVKLVIEDSPVLEDLQALVEGGVEILACGTCLVQFRT
jgi:selenium metabolism protein YedF